MHSGILPFLDLLAAGHRTATRAKRNCHTMVHRHDRRRDQSLPVVAHGSQVGMGVGAYLVYGQDRTPMPAKFPFHFAPLLMSVLGRWFLDDRHGRWPRGARARSWRPGQDSLFAPPWSQEEVLPLPQPQGQLRPCEFLFRFPVRVWRSVNVSSSLVSWLETPPTPSLW